MLPEMSGPNIRARCPDCNGAMSTFEAKEGGNPPRFVLRPGGFLDPDGTERQNRLYTLLRCAGCGRGGLATIDTDNNAPIARNSWLIDFYPVSIESLPIPSVVPDGIAKEFREAEQCAAIGAWRAASALLRSTLEKTLKANGYTKGQLAPKIDAAAADGVITEQRRKRAHEDVRSLGNDVLHDEWREVSQEEVEVAHGYVQRVIEDFYDDRPTVESILTTKGRLKPHAAEDMEDDED